MTVGSGKLDWTSEMVNRWDDVRYDPVRVVSLPNPFNL